MALLEIPEDGCMLRVFVGESDRAHGKALYEWVVLQARERGLRGATVLRGVLGYGANSQLQYFRVTRLSTDLPVVIEIVDQRPRLEAFLRSIQDQITDGLVIMQDVQVYCYCSSTETAS
jgi:PII-like signaling protein